MTLKPVNKNGNRYCGPAVISSLTGMTTDDAAATIRRVTNVRAVRGVAIWQMRRVLDELGYIALPVAEIDLTAKPTLAAWLRASRARRTAGRMFMVIAGHHWQLISGRRYVCGRTVQIVSIRDKQVKRRARVRLVWEIKKLKGGAA
jgi:hypothetical protein